MANLKDIFGSILRDMVMAQHQTNLFSQSLSESYSKSGRTSRFTLPSVSLGEVEFNLRYAINGGLQEIKEEDINYSETNKKLLYVTRESIDMLIKVLVKYVKASKIEYRENGYDFIDSLQDNFKFKHTLSTRFFNILTEDVGKIMADDGKSFDVDKLGDMILSAAEENIIMNNDIKEIFDLPGGSQLRDTVKSNFESVIKTDMDDILRESKDGNFRKIQRFGSLNVELDSNVLAQLPESAIHTFTIKVTPQTLKDVDINNRR